MTGESMKESQGTGGSGAGSPPSAGPSRARGVVKFVFWTLMSAGVFGLMGYWHATGRLSAWYYYSAGEDGYAVDADAFREATPESPAFLEIADRGSIEGLVAVPVKKGDRLPENANGVITGKVIEEAKRASLEAGRLKVTVPWKIEQAKGFKFKDTFKHKGIKTWPWGAVINVLVVIGLGVFLGMMAEGFTDALGIKLEKIKHFEGGH